MKKIQDSYKNPVLPKSLLRVTPITTAIVPLQPQEQKIISDWERLTAQAERINQMARELEAAILELKLIASTLNAQKRYPLLKHELWQNICQYFAVSVPWIKQKPDKSFILTTRKIDLFRAEREAAQLAQQLRQQSKKKGKALQRHRKNKSKGEDETRPLLKKMLINKS